MPYKIKPVAIKLKKFWNLDPIRIYDKESSACEKSVDIIEFINNRYEVYHLKTNILEDSDNLCLKRLKNLKKKLVFNNCLLVDFDNIIKNQFHKGVIEQVTSPPLVGNTTYLPQSPSN